MNCDMQGADDGVQDWIDFISATDLQQEKETTSVLDHGTQQRSTGTQAWEDFSESVEQGRVQATCVVDFPYQDGSGPSSLTLSKADALFGRMFCFEQTSPGSNQHVRFVIHVHTLLQWQKRTAVSVQDRSKRITSVSLRQGTKTEEGWSCELSGYTMVPIDEVLRQEWRLFNVNKQGSMNSDISWEWADDSSLPRLESRAHVLAYSKVRHILKVGHSFLGHVYSTETQPKVQALRTVCGEGTVECDVIAVRKGSVENTRPPEFDESALHSECLCKPKPTPPASRFGWLFIGASNPKLVKIDVKSEYYLIRDGLRDLDTRNDHYETGDVVDVIKNIDSDDVQPLLILHLACHGENQKMELQESSLKARQLNTAIAGHNTGRRVKHPIQILVLNMCNSAAMMPEFAELDFVIGHHGLLKDEHATTFAEIFYSKLGSGQSLYHSFCQARTAASDTGYALHAQKDATKMYLSAAPQLTSAGKDSTNVQAVFPSVKRDIGPLSTCHSTELAQHLSVGKNEDNLVSMIREYLVRASVADAKQSHQAFCETGRRLSQAATVVAEVVASGCAANHLENCQETRARDKIHDELVTCGKTFVEKMESLGGSEFLDAELRRLKATKRDAGRTTRACAFGTQDSLPQGFPPSLQDALQDMVRRYDEWLLQTSERQTSLVGMRKLIGSMGCPFLQELKGQIFRLTELILNLQRAKDVLTLGRGPRAGCHRRMKEAQDKFLSVSRRYQIARIMEGNEPEESGPAARFSSADLRAQLVSARQELEGEWHTLHDLADNAFPELPKLIYEQLHDSLSHGLKLPAGGRIFQPFQSWDNYRVLQQLAKSGDGSRHNVWRVALGSEVVVLKQFDLGRSEQSGVNVRVMQQEVNNLLRMAHPHVIMPQLFFIERDARGSLQGYVQFPFYPGASMDQWLRTSEAKNRTNVLMVIHDLLEGLDHVHYNKVVHCDVKTGNVLLGPISDTGCRRAVLGDFELSLAPKERGLLSVRSASQSVVGARGTLGLLSMAPEVIHHAQEPTVRSDMYGFGGVVLQSLYPQQAQTWMQGAQQWDQAGCPTLELPADARLILLLLSQHPDTRPMASEILEGKHKLPVTANAAQQSEDEDDRESASGSKSGRDSPLLSPTTPTEANQASHSFRGLRVPPYWQRTKGGLHFVTDPYVVDVFQDWMTRSKCRSGTVCNDLQVPEVVRAVRIENTLQWRMYSAARVNLEEKTREWQEEGLTLPSLGDVCEQEQPQAPFIDLHEKLNEVLLFHCTSRESAMLIAQHGFDERVASSSGKYGAGCYFADQFCESNQWAVRDESGDCVVLVCRVLMGWAHMAAEQNMSQRRPPLNPDTPGRPFDSVFAARGRADDGKQLHNEYVVPDRLVYPEWMVHYRLRDPALAAGPSLPQYQFPDYWRCKTGARAVHFVEDNGLKDFMQHLVETSISAGCGERSSCSKKMRLAKVTNVRRVENPRLWRSYQTMKELMEEESSGWPTHLVPDLRSLTKPVLASVRGVELSHKVNELWLWHGTNLSTVDIIAVQGFDERVASLKGLYGAGCYFADTSCKSAQYCGEGDSHGERVLILSRVLLGWPFKAKKGQWYTGIRMAPPNPLTGRPHDTLFAASGVGNNGRQVHNEFIIFDRNQVYPEYLVYFKTEEPGLPNPGLGSRRGGTCSEPATHPSGYTPNKAFTLFEGLSAQRCARRSRQRGSGLARAAVAVYRMERKRKMDEVRKQEADTEAKKAAELQAQEEAHLQT